ncbi:MAG: DUF3800 domain-containing protein [Chloroflexi bacterium]|nr:DUF3800 domain-containing protein [Chloroflexota bacterium]
MLVQRLADQYPELVYRCYIDESGDEGYKFDPRPGYGSKPWFILTGVVTQDIEDLSVSRSINRIKARLFGHLPAEKQRKPLHWRDLKHEQKRVVVRELRNEAFWFISVAVCKEHLDRADFIKNPEHLFGYTSRLLIERVTWLVNDLGGVVQITFSNRARFPLNKVRAYMDLLRRDTHTQVRDVFDPEEVIVRNMDQLKMLQVADACAGATYNALVPDFYDNTETSYLRELAPRFYRYHTGRLMSYGLKILPGSGRAFEAICETHGWLRKVEEWD